MSSETLAQVIASLPEEERIILTLHYLKGLSTGQIAQILHVPERAVSNVIASGRSHLTSRLNI